MGDTGSELLDIESELLAAEQEYKEACHTTSVARSNEVEALNKLNSVQKKFDEVTKKIRDRAGNGSTWNEQKRNRMKGVDG